jgi:hypothetical protein
MLKLRSMVCARTLRELHPPARPTNVRFGSFADITDIAQILLRKSAMTGAWRRLKDKRRAGIMARPAKTRDMRDEV